MLSNFFHIPGHPGTWSYGGAAFSPSGRFLYTIDLSWYIYQYDLESPDIEASKTLVGEYDGFLINNFWSTEFGDMQLGPDCRIYIATPGSNRYLHVINQPDNPGLECDFIQRAVKLPTWYSGTIPPFSNYRLDSIPTYPCDSNIVLIPHDPSWVWERSVDTEKLQAWPNPSAGDFTLSLPQTAGRLVIFDPLGREVWRRELASHEKEIEVEAAGWAPGLYHCAFAGEDGRVFAVVLLARR
jgi:hypothetical protein